VQFGFKPFRMKKAELLATLNDFLVEQYRAGRKLVLVVDEAQNLTSTVLEEVRLLSGIETTKEKVLRIILAGQPELSDKLDAPDLEQLAQRIRLRFHLPARRAGKSLRRIASISSIATPAVCRVSSTPCVTLQ
jgi:general secretion pathway protein A